MKHVYYRALPAIGKIAILVSMGMFPFFAYSQAVTQPAHWHSHSQETATNGDDSLAGFDANPFLQTALSKRLDARETALYLERAKRNYINAKYNLGRASSTTANPAARFGNPPSAAMAPCTNMDFETGNFTGWSGFKGENTLSSAGPLQNIQAGFFSTGINASITDMNARHTIVQNPGAGNDVCGGFPCVAPGGSYSVRLGNDYANYQGEAIEQTFTVGATNTSFTYNYAVVLNDGGHSQGEQPYFRIEMYDSLGNPIPCAQYFVEAGGSIPGFISCGLSTYYKPWTTVNIDLTAYMGQDVMIRFTAAGCIFAGHYAYAYVDASCLPYSISTSDSLCVGNSITLSAPVGAASYLWNTNDTTQSITISTPGSYSVSMMSVTGCQTLLTQNVGIYPEPTAAFNPTYVPCGLTYTFNDSSSVASGTLSYHWDFGIPSQTGDTSNLSNPVFTYPGIGTHTVTLVVLTNNGCVDSATMIVYPGNGGQAAFSATTECAGNATMFTDQSTGTSAWSWNFGDTASGANDSSNVQHPTHIFTASGTYTVTLLVNTVPCPSLISHVITVDPVPVAAMSYSQICGAQNATFNSSSTVGYPGTIVLHEWDFGDPGSGANNTSQLTNPSHSFSGPGVYTVMLVVTTDAGCSDTTTMALNVGPGPIANFTTTSVCTGTQMQFNNTSANTAAWYWNFGVGSTLADTSNLENPTYLYTNPGSYVVTLIGNPGPCADSYTQTVTVFPMPVAQFTAPLVCYGYPTIFTDQSIVSSGSIASWNWDFGVSTSNGDTSSVQNPNYIYPVGATYTVSLTVTSNNGCSATDTVVVNVAQLPVANFASDVVCVGYPVTFTDLSTANSGNLTTWTWDFGDGSPPDYQQHPVHPYPSEGTYNVTLVVTTSFGCIDTIVLPAVTDAMPVIAFLADTLAGCPTLCVEFSDMTTIASGNVTSWEWDFGDSTVPVYQQNPSHCFSITGLYDITLTATSAGGCSTTLVINDMIEVYPEPHASFLATPPLTTVVQPHIEFTDISTGTPVKWQWDFGDPTTLGDTSGIPYPSYTYSNEYGTTYNVWLTVTNSYGCVDDTMLQVLVEPEFTFFIPNAFTPNNDGKNDLFFGTGIGINKYEIWIFDRWGNMIWNSKDMNEGWPGIVQGSSGDICQEDVYVWKVIVTDVWNKKHKFIGHVSLIR